MASNKVKFNPFSLVGKTLDLAIDSIYSDIDYIGNSSFYWLSVPQISENRSHFIRFPHGPEFSIEYENGIITKVY